MITVQVPATTANLGPGFDCFGMALTLYGRFTFEELPAGLCFEGVPEAFCNADNLAVRAYFSALKAINLPQAGLFLRIASDIPVSHGLGSSASLWTSLILLGVAIVLELVVLNILRVKLGKKTKA